MSEERSPCDREGTFKAKITDYGTRETEGQAVAVTIQVTLLEMWDGSEWQEWEQYGMEAAGDLWVVKKDGTPNNNPAKSLIEHAGWDGSFASITNRTWQPTPCQVVIKRDDYKDQVRYRVEFVNAYDRTPGQVSNVSPDKARELDGRFGSHFRALAGNTKRNGSAPAPGKPATPPASSRPTPPPVQAGTSGEIPF